MLQKHSCLFRCFTIFFKSLTLKYTIRVLCKKRISVEFIKINFILNFIKHRTCLL